MKRLAEFVVKGRIPIFVISLLLAGVCVYLMTLVYIDRDPSSTMPADSMTRLGYDAMDSEFEETTPLKVMYWGLSEDEVETVATDLENLTNVSSVTYEQGEEGTSAEGKTLYTLYLVGNSYSTTADEALAAVRDYTEGSGAKLSGSVLDTVDQLSTLGVNIIFALAILLAILLIMCSSWIEPLLFIVVICIAVLYNMGTNAFLPSVGLMTFSVAAVLQLALSMDYSIMLTDRYRQEREKTDDKCEAMVNALQGGFAAIASSSFTTVAGMLCLVFMSFAIGKDMGVVLGKGVAFSLVCVLLVLPGLMVMCDGAIMKTRKPFPRPKLRLLARFSSAMRFPVLIVFVALMVFGFAQRDSTSIAYFMDSSNEDQAAIEEAFPPTQEIVVVYATDGDVSGAFDEIAAMDGVDSFQSYENTVGKSYTATALAEELGMDSSVVDLMYYDYLNGSETGKLTVNRVASFIESDVAGNETFADKLGGTALDSVGTLKNMSDASYVTEQMTAGQIASAMGVDEEQAEQLVLYYYIEQGDVDTGTLTLAEFVSFLRESVVGNDLFAGQLDESMTSQLDLFAVLTNPADTAWPLSYTDFAQVTGMDESLVKTVYEYYYLATQDVSGLRLTVTQVLSAIDAMAQDSRYASYFTSDQLAQLEQLRTIAEGAQALTEYDAGQLAEMFGLEKTVVEQLLQLSVTLWSLDFTPTTLNVTNFLNLLLDGVAYNETVLAMLDPTMAAGIQAKAAELEQLRTLANLAVSQTTLNPSEAAAALGLDGSLANMLYLESGVASGAVTLPSLSIRDFLAFVLDTMVADPTLRANFDQDALTQLYQARGIVESAVAGETYDAFGIAEILNIAPDSVRQLLVYRAWVQGGEDSWTVDLATILPFTVETVEAAKAEAGDGSQASDAQASGDESGDAISQRIAEAVDDDQLAQLKAVAKIVAGAQDGAVYSAAEMAALFNELSGNGEGKVTENEMALLYLYEASQTSLDASATMTLEQFVTFASDETSQNPLFTGLVDEDAQAELDDAKQTIADAKDSLVGETYSRAMVEVTPERESQEMIDLVHSMESVLDETGVEYYLVGESSMAVEMQETFTTEYAFITLLTAAVIFVIVAITFKSLFIPLVLVLLIQTAINLMLFATMMQGVSTYYVALMLVQALLMGATIDYAILLTSSYREWRLQYERREALQHAMQASIGTIMTSSSILILVTFVIGLTSADVTISEVCMTISKGSLSSVLLVLLLLPGVLSALDRFVAGPGVVLRPEDTLPPTPPTGARSYALPLNEAGAAMALEEPAEATEGAEKAEGAGDESADEDEAKSETDGETEDSEGGAEEDAQHGAPSKEEEFDKWFDDFYRSYTEARGGSHKASGSESSDQ